MKLAEAIERLAATKKKLAELENARATIAASHEGHLAAVQVTDGQLSAAMAAMRLGEGPPDDVTDAERARDNATRAAAADECALATIAERTAIAKAEHDDAERQCLSYAAPLARERAEELRRGIVAAAETIGRDITLWLRLENLSRAGRGYQHAGFVTGMATSERMGVADIFERAGVRVEFSHRLSDSTDRMMPDELAAITT